MTTAVRKDTRTITQILFSRKREVDLWPSLKGGQEIRYPARRNPGPVGYLSAMLCKACVVALRGEVLGINALEPLGDVSVQSRSQTSSHIYQCYLLSNEAYLPRGQVTYHLGLLFLAEALACAAEARDLLDALEEILEHRDRMPAPDERYDELLAHLSDELYYWARYRNADPARSADALEELVVRDTEGKLYRPVLREIDPKAFTDPNILRTVRRNGSAPTPPAESATPLSGAKFRGPQLAELVESLDLGMHSLLVGPTATGKSLCALEAFEYTREGKAVFVIEGHESLREFDLLGGYAPDGHGGFVWNDGVLVRAMRSGGFLFIDEANRMPTRTLNVLLGVLSRRAVVLTERGSEEVEAQEGFQVVMAMNLGQGYAVNTLDRALVDRFPCVLEFQYLSSREEEELLVAETRVDREVARSMVKVANETRKLRRNRELSGELTPRGLFAWARKFQVKRGSLLDRLQDAASTTWLHQVAGVDADGYLRGDAAASILSLIEAHTGSR
jgi:MoxR-like ATPase